MICQLATVKTRLGISDTTDDTLLTNFIELCGQRFEDEMARKVERSTTATQEFGAERLHLPLERFPVESIATWKLKDNEVDGYVNQDVPKHTLNKRAGVVLVGYPIGVAGQVLEIGYTGGYVLPGGTPTGGQTALPDVLEHSAVEQVAYWYQNRHRLGLTSIPAEGRTFYSLRVLDLLPNVVPVLRTYGAIHL